MEIKFIHSGLGFTIDALKQAAADGYSIEKKYPGTDNPDVVLRLYKGNEELVTFNYQSEDRAISDAIMVRDLIPEVVQRIPAVREIPDVKVDQPSDLEVVNGVTLPAGAKLDTETPAEIKNPQLDKDIEGLLAAGLTSYNIGVAATGAYKIELFRGNSLAFEYFYQSSDERANDMAVVLDRLPKLQFIGGPEFVS